MRPLMTLAGRLPPYGSLFEDRRRRSGFSASSLLMVDRVLEKIVARCGLTVWHARNSRTKEATAARREWLVVVQDTWALSSVETSRLCGVDHTSVLLAQKHRAADRARELALVG